MIEINLIPDVKRELIKAQRTRSTVVAGTIIVGIVSIAVVVLLAMYVFGVQALRGKLADDAIDKGIKTLKRVDDLPKTLTIQNQLTKISSLNADKKIDSRIFDVLRAIIPPAPNDILISTLLIDSTNSTISMEGQASNSYVALETFKKIIESAKIKYTDSSNSAKDPVYLASNISIGKTSYGESSTGQKVLRFSLSFVYAPELFSVATSNMAITISINGNVTDSYLGIPKSIFTEKAVDLTEEQ